MCVLFANKFDNSALDTFIKSQTVEPSSGSSANPEHLSTGKFRKIGDPKCPDLDKLKEEVQLLFMSKKHA